ncbi:hypothetical protein Misp01_62620 [Microtetraspora sp. NBRC 13810]|uniref:glycoside hydrolase family 16 protein n=1 Tax=Microtetraspora sp. NBRC 13810 TaxID=3030990 RepID=UPI0024A5F302|nr:glycoside hydrolase family 16 protein [Microtetraspora sp. NBRC 13810]GLW11134.1 hypothetical protein Misp01_62620 [Microtetraspora sp. NBRC 13810]
MISRLLPRALVRTVVLGTVAALAVTSLPSAQATAAGPCPADGAHPNWGAPVWCEEFTDHVDTSDWEMYNSAGHAGNGRRTQDQAFIGGGSLFLWGRENGDTAGMATRFAQARGRWETRIRLYPGAGNYHPVALLWPQNGGGNVASATGEEIDYFEVVNDPQRQRANFFLHAPGGRQEQAHANIDLTQWHTYGVEVSADGIVGYLDGREWFRSSRTTQSPMTATLQLDWFPGDNSPGEGWMEVDWLRIYPLTTG